MGHFFEFTFELISASISFLFLIDNKFYCDDQLFVFLHNDSDPAHTREKCEAI